LDLREGFVMPTHGHAGALARYNAALKAVAEARSVDEIRLIRDEGEALRLAAKVAKRRDIELDGAEIRLRAERRLGEMLRASERAPGGTPYHHNGTGSAAEQVAQPTLAELGIDRKLSSRAQEYAACPAEAFQGALAVWRERAATGDRVPVNLTEVLGDSQGDPRPRRREAATPATVYQSIDKLLRAARKLRQLIMEMAEHHPPRAGDQGLNDMAAACRLAGWQLTDIGDELSRFAAEPARSEEPEEEG
jgi:hypothetical protein